MEMFSYLDLPTEIEKNLQLAVTARKVRPKLRHYNYASHESLKPPLATRDALDPNPQTLILPSSPDATPKPLCTPKCLALMNIPGPEDSALWGLGFTWALKNLPF